MKRFLSSYLFIIVSAIIILIIQFFWSPFEIKKNENETVAFFSHEKDTLKVLLTFHASDYFIYKGTPIGFQYELLKELKKAIGKPIDIKVMSNFDSVYTEVFKDQYDIIALDFRRSGIVAPLVTFSYPHSFTYPVLITRKEVKVMDSVDKKVFVPNYYHHFISTEELKQKKFNLVFQKENNSEELFDLIQDKKIDYMVCDYHLAVTLLPFYSTLKIIESAGPTYERSWVLNKKNNELNQEINNWIATFSKTKKYTHLIKKYFSPHSAVISGSFTKSTRNSISTYDHIIKKYASIYNVDWRFAASIIFQESKFQNGLVGLGGSFGLMQLMPETMEHFGINEFSSDEEHIAAGIKYISLIAKSFQNITNKIEQYHFIAASYNAGRGHVLDAQRLCEKYLENSTQWDFVSKYLILKSKSEYANDPVVKSGFFPGKHAVKYANEVVERYEAYLLMYP